MLKLERTNQLGITLRLRERERFLDSQFLKAFFIALLLHLGSLVIFHVAPFQASPTFIFPAIQVQSNASTGITALVTSYLYENEDLIPPSPPLIPSLNWISHSIESHLSPTLNLDTTILQQIDRPEWAAWQPLLSITLEEPLIQLAISGELAKRSLTLIPPLLNKKEVTNLHRLDPFLYVSYHVQVDERTGQIFWYERDQTSGNSEIDQLTENILLDLQFEVNQTLDDIIGTLNFIVSPTLIQQND